TPVDGRVHVAEQRIVGGLALVLWLARRATLRDQLHAVEHRLYPEREERLEVERARRVVGPDRPLAPEEDRSGVDAGVGPERGDPGAGSAADELQGDGAAAAIAREERRVKADRRLARQMEQRLGDDLRDVCEDRQVGAGERERLARIDRLERRELMRGDGAGD